MILATGTIGATLLGALIGGVFAVIVMGVPLYFAQRNRSQDKVDSATVARVSSQTEEVKAALDAWSRVNAATATHAASLTQRLDRVQAQADDCDRHRTQLIRQLDELSAEVMNLREQLPGRT